MIQTPEQRLINALVSYFGRVNYSYKDRYLFEANLRRDASSRFAKDNRVGISHLLLRGGDFLRRTL